MCRRSSISSDDLDRRCSIAWRSWPAGPANSDPVAGGVCRSPARNNCGNLISSLHSGMETPCTGRARGLQVKTVRFGRPGILDHPALRNIRIDIPQIAVTVFGQAMMISRVSWIRLLHVVDNPRV